MATYLLTIQQADHTDLGLRLSPGLRLSQPRDRPAIGQMKQGAKLELRGPDGARRLTHLATYGVSVWKGEDGTFYTQENPSDPKIKLFLPEELTPEDVPPGTEVWLLEAEG
jgi:hypothetical protein